MTTTEQHNAEVTRKFTERNKIADFAMQTFHMDEIRAEAFAKVCGSFLRWDGTLQFKTASGEYVAADDPQCTGFFEREYLGPVFGMSKKSEGDGGATLDPDLIAKAKAGNLTAKSQLFTALHAGKPRSEEAATVAALDKLLAGDDSGETKRDDKGKFVANGHDRDDGKSNPFKKAGWNLTAQGAIA